MRLTSAPLPKQGKREVGLYPEGGVGGGGGGESGLIIVFCFVLLKVDGPLTVQLKVQ